MAYHLHPRRRAHLAGEIGIVDELGQRDGQRLRVVGRHHEAGVPVDHLLGHAARAAHDDGEPVGHRLEHDVR